MKEKAEELFHKAWTKGWDTKFGGLYFALSSIEDLIDSDKNYWVMAEAISAASLLAVQTKNNQYWKAYDLLFNYCWKYLIDHQHRGWYQLLNNENKMYSDEKSPVPKTDYHPVAACYQTIRVLT
jgi:mannose/cellobiose epimerase-like protein (N-acyl-D-glucosamine 2-epimerase family)